MLAIRRAFQPPIALPGADLPPAGDFFLKGQIQQVLKRFALPMLDVGAPGAGEGLSALRLGGPVALPSLAVFLRPPGSTDNNLSGGGQRPVALGRVGVLGTSAACPRSLKALSLASSGDPGAVDGLCRFLSKRADKEQKRDQPNRYRERPANDTPPKQVPVAKSPAAQGGKL